MKSLFKAARYAIVTDGNWPGQRNRMLRNCSPADWYALYGPRYHYSSDYILSHRHAYTPTTRVLARLANLAEEAGEVLQRFSTLHIRLVGSMIPGMLRDMSNRGRFCQRLYNRLIKAGNTVAANTGLSLEDVGSLVCELQKRKIINARAQLIVAPDRLADALAPVFEAFSAERSHCPARGLTEYLTQSSNGGVPAELLARAIKGADMRAHWGMYTRQRSLAHALGCAAAYGTGLALGALVLTLSTGVAGSYMGKFLALGALMFTISLTLRIGIVAHARLFQTYRGLPHGYRYDGLRPYRSLYELLQQQFRRLRVAVYPQLNLPALPAPGKEADVGGVSCSASERTSAPLARLTGHAWPLRLLSGAVCAIQQTGDLIYSADSNISRIVGRSARAGFCSYTEHHQHAGVTARGTSSYNWHTRSASSARLGRLRLAIARVVGIGGTDCIGGAIGCMSVSAAWTAFNMSTGGLGGVGLVAGQVLGAGLGGVLIGGGLWATSAMLHAPIALTLQQKQEQQRAQEQT